MTFAKTNDGRSFCCYSPVTACAKTSPSLRGTTVGAPFSTLPQTTQDGGSYTIRSIFRTERRLLTVRGTTHRSCPTRNPRHFPDPPQGAASSTPRDGMCSHSMQSFLRRLTTSVICFANATFSSKRRKLYRGTGYPSPTSSYWFFTPLLTRCGILDVETPERRPPI